MIEEATILKLFRKKWKVDLETDRELLTDGNNEYLVLVK